MNLKIIGRVNCDFPTKFGLPRQSGLADIRATVVMEKEYSDINAFRGLDGYSHIWLLWGFSEVKEKEFTPTVRPPRLGGNKRMGVFATRSPFRPNPVGLSCVKLDKVEQIDGKVMLHVRGADMMNGTPVYDIKPYLPHADCVRATSGFSGEVLDYSVKVEFLPEAEEKIDFEDKKLLLEILSQDPRPSYVEDGERVYGFSWKDKEIKFKVSDGVLTVVEIEVIK